MTRDLAWSLIERVARGWVEDEESSVVWSGVHDGKPGLRMRQGSRDFTTVWFEVGDRTVGLEAYLMPTPRYRKEEVYRQCLARNLRSWPVWIAAGREGDLYVLGRAPLDEFDDARLDEMVGGVYELVEIAFRALVTAGFTARETSP